jgi:hypothetical protein
VSFIIYYRDHDGSRELDGTVRDGGGALRNRNQVLAGKLPLDTDYWYASASARVGLDARVGDKVYAFVKDYEGVVAEGVVTQAARPLTAAEQATLVTPGRRLGVVHIRWTKRFATDIPTDTVRRATGLTEAQWVGYARGGLIPLPMGVVLDGNSRPTGTVSPERRAAMEARLAERRR